MSSSTRSKHPKSRAREYAVQFLYQCEMERFYYFPEGHFGRFAEHLEIPPQVKDMTHELCRGTLQSLPELDERIEGFTEHWPLRRMGSIDRNVLRLATFEILHTDTPPKVAVNEAIELAKKFGAAESGAFVNGILDRLIRHRKSDPV